MKKKIFAFILVFINISVNWAPETWHRISRFTGGKYLCYFRLLQWETRTIPVIVDLIFTSVAPTNSFQHAFISSVTLTSPEVHSFQTIEKYPHYPGTLTLLIVKQYEMRKKQHESFYQNYQKYFLYSFYDTQGQYSEQVCKICLNTFKLRMLQNQ